MKLTQQTLKELLDYDADTGVFKWKAKPSKSIMVGSNAGVIDISTGYIKIGILGNKYYAHRLAWMYVNGSFPYLGVDHVNGNKQDNRIENLREANQSQNTSNTRKKKKNGLKGAFLHNGGWQAKICVGGKKFYLGTFDTEQEAHNAYCAAAIFHHKEFCRFD